MIGLTVLLICCTSTDRKLAMNDLINSTWQLDEKSHQAIVHQCVETDFTDTPATFILKRCGEDMLLQFNGQHHIWNSPANKRYFYASQVLRSSTSGRLCGFQTEISIYFRLIGNDQSKIKGTWRTTHCDICPKVDFIAYRID
jgi:hypothetical protein